MLSANTRAILVVMAADVIPQFVFTPDNVLEVKVTDRVPREDDSQAFMTEAQQQELKGRILEGFSILDHVEAVDNDGVAEISVDIEPFLSDQAPWNYEKTDELLALTNDLIDFHPQDGIDRVAGIDGIYDRGAAVTINQHFQRWLESPGAFSEELARRAVEAMAMPFEAELTKNLLGKEYRYVEYTDGGYFAGADAMFGIVIRRDEFGLHRVSDDPEVRSESADVNWYWTNISTIGNCACWGTDGIERGHLYIEGESKRLYELVPHNVDYSLQAISQVLALGVMTHAASQYEGQEDIFADTDWQQSRY